MFALTLDSTDAHARIVIGDFSERFSADLSYWSPRQYRQQWKRALDRALGGKPSALITSVSNPATMNYLFWWPLYPNAGTIHVQNHVLFISEHPEFDLSRWTEFVPLRITKNEDGDTVSEWTTSEESVSDFLDSLSKE